MSHPEYKNIGDPAIHLIEECSELIKAVCKGKRFGWNNCHPAYPNIDNRQKMNDEMRDVLEAYLTLKSQIAGDK